jgi:hypothetical protein
MIIVKILLSLAYLWLVLVLGETPDKTREGLDKIRRDTKEETSARQCIYISIISTISIIKESSINHWNNH